METNRILIETTIIIEYLRTRHRTTSTNFEKAIAKFDECCLSVITVYEVEFGAARIHADLVALNQEIGVKDVFIAAAAMINELPILTHNIKHFRCVPGLQVISPSDM